MRLGIVTDVHNHTAALAGALAIFRERGVDRVVTIGDTCDPFLKDDRAGHLASLLDGCGATGVWGNHDFTLCWNPPDAVRERYPPQVLGVMTRMEPRLVIGDCHFSHMESSVDPFDVAQLWDHGDSPLDLMQRARLAFAATDSLRQFVGHYHRWWAATPEGPIAWAGDGPLHLDARKRYFVVVAATCDGWCAILDTDQGLLEPLRCGPDADPDVASGAVT